MKIAVIYQSTYGSTKQYAQWIAEDLAADCIDRKSVKPAKLLEYDLVIYGGGIYAGKISGINLVTKHPCKQLLLFTVGFENPETANFNNLIESNLPAAMRGQVPTFHLRGDLDYSQMSVLHKGMMAMFKKVLEKTPEAERTEDVKMVLETYGKKLSCVDRATIAPILDYVRNL